MDKVFPRQAAVLSAAEWISQHADEAGEA
jgi:hypothetical protein